MSSKIPVGRHDFCQASFSVAPSNPQLSRRHTCASASTRHHHHLTYRRPFLRTGVTLSPHLSLRAPPLPAHSLSRLDTAPAHKEGLEAPHRLKGHRNRPLQPWRPKEKPPILSVSTMRENPQDYAIAIAIAITRARAHTNRSSNVFFNSASTSATSRAMVRPNELFRYGFRFSTSPLPWHHRARQDTLALHAQESWTWIMAGLTSLIPSQPISSHRRLVSV